jgi:hypothetical protein
VSSIVWTLQPFFASKTLHNRKNLKKKSGDVNYEANFSFYFLLHKRDGWIGGQREKVRGEYRFEFARVGEREGKGGV